MATTIPGSAAALQLASPLQLNTGSAFIGHDRRINLHPLFREIVGDRSPGDVCTGPSPFVLQGRSHATGTH